MRTTVLSPTEAKHFFETVLKTAQGFVGVQFVRSTDGDKWRWTKDSARIGTADQKPARSRPKRSKCVLWVKDLTARAGTTTNLVVTRPGEFAASGVKGALPEGQREAEDEKNNVLTVFCPTLARRVRASEEKRLKEAQAILEFIREQGQEPTDAEIKDSVALTEEEIAASCFRRVSFKSGQTMRVRANGGTFFLTVQ